MLIKPTSRWHKHFLDLALAHARMSKDPSTQVGALIIGPDREVRSTGYNGLPRGIADTEERLHNRELKYKLIVHAELNAILNAARVGIPVKNCTMYITATNKENLIWGGPPCTRCTVELIQSGITEIITYKFKNVPSKWYNDLIVAKDLLFEAGINYIEVDL